MYNSAASAPCCGGLAMLLPSVTNASLPQGATAPQFATQGALAGRTFAFNLRAALQRGPVVLYFYPKAFTQGCTLEANAFAEAHGQFAAAGATVPSVVSDEVSPMVTVPVGWLVSLKV